MLNETFSVILRCFFLKRKTWSPMEWNVESYKYTNALMPMAGFCCKKQGGPLNWMCLTALHLAWWGFLEAITLHTTEVVKLSLSWCFHLISHGNGLQAVAVDSLFYCQVGHQSVEINLKHLLVLTVETFSPLYIMENSVSWGWQRRTIWCCQTDDLMRRARLDRPLKTVT